MSPEKLLLSLTRIDHTVHHTHKLSSSNRRGHTFREQALVSDRQLSKQVHLMESQFEIAPIQALIALSEATKSAIHFPAQRLDVVGLINSRHRLLKNMEASP
jgi:hypothetical protein